MQACSKNTSEIALEIAAEIANDWNFPGLQVVACAPNSGLQIKIKMIFDDFLFMFEVAPQYSQSRVLRRGSNVRSIMPILAIQALDGGISSKDTVTRSLTPPTSLALTHLSNMTFVSNDPSWWPYIDSEILYSYWMVAAGVVVVYEWVLTIGQEIELIWRQRWSLMTVLYLVIRYVGIPYSVVNVLAAMFVSLTDTGCNILYYALSWANVVIAAMLGVIMIVRLHAMYQGSRTMLIFLVIIFLAVNISCGVLAAIGLKNVVVEEGILSGIYMCGYFNGGNTLLLVSMVWMLNTVWEVLALCISVWIAVKHFRDLRRLGPSTGSTIGDCFRVLMKSHVLYFVSFAGVPSLQLLNFFVFSNSYSIGSYIFAGVFQILIVVQMFVLGPRLILSVREYHAKLVAGSDADASMNSIVFQEHVHISTSGTV